ncbi:MAG: hypothetical protein OHK0029_19660 [Armatimonadaceae bacterium]
MRVMQMPVMQKINMVVMLNSGMSAKFAVNMFVSTVYFMTHWFSILPYVPSWFNKENVGGTGTGSPLHFQYTRHSVILQK